MDLSDRIAVDENLAYLYNLIGTHHLWLCDRTLSYHQEDRSDPLDRVLVDKWLAANFLIKTVLARIEGVPLDFKSPNPVHGKILASLEAHYLPYRDLIESCAAPESEKRIYLGFVQSVFRELNRARGELFEENYLGSGDDRERERTASPAWDGRFNEIIDNIGDGLVVVDGKGEVLFVNRAAEELFGQPGSKLLGQYLGVPVMSAETVEIEIVQRDGNYKSVRMRSLEIRWENEKAYLAYLNDITEFKQLEQKLKILVQASEQSPISIIITDAEGNIEYVNRKFQDLTGYTEEEVRGKKPKLLKSGHTPEETYRELWQTVLSGREWRGEFLNKKKNGELFWEQASIAPIKNEEGMITHLVAVKENITERKESDALLSYQANYDALTSLPNRFLAMDRLRQAIHCSERQAGRVALMFIDLDKFKNVNDTLGHEYGDQLLQLASIRLMNCLRKSDTVARLGGDEFLVIVSNLSELNQCELIANKILTALRMPFNLLGEEVFISASIGITIYPDDGRDISLLMRNADTAMYEGKKSGRDTFNFYTRGMNEKAQHRISVENQLRRAVEKKEIFTVYQPIINLSSGEIVGAEALIRWRNPRYGRVPPSVFIPIAEDTGLIDQLGGHVLTSACREAARWHARGHKLSIAVNISGRQLRSADFVERVAAAINCTGLDGRYLELEITEDCLLENAESVRCNLARLDEMNIRLTVDDFGTGYSALSYLKKFPFKRLKVDRSFMTDLPDDDEKASLVRTILAMARGLGLQAIAEGVETERQLNFLRRENCDYAQGYLFNRPLLAGGFGRLLSEKGGNWVGSAQ